MVLKIQEFYDKETGTFSYVVWDATTKDAIAIDPVWNYDGLEAKLSSYSIIQLKDFIQDERLSLLYILDTHVHADHLSGVARLKEFFPMSKTAIGKNVIKVQSLFKERLNLDDLHCDGSQFDILLDEDMLLNAGSIEIQTIFTPGHTPACSSYLIGENLFVGDAIFMPDYGTGRCDFPAGSAEDLYRSISEKIFTLPAETKIYVGHDYGPGGRAPAFLTTVGEQITKNIHVNKNSTKEEFKKFREQRDATLSSPKLLYPSLQVNLRGGELPPSEKNGIRFFKIPIQI